MLQCRDGAFIELRVCPDEFQCSGYSDGADWVYDCAPIDFCNDVGDSSRSYMTYYNDTPVEVTEGFVGADREVSLLIVDWEPRASPGDAIDITSPSNRRWDIEQEDFATHCVPDDTGDYQQCEFPLSPQPTGSLVGMWDWRAAYISSSSNYIDGWCIRVSPTGLTDDGGGGGGDDTPLCTNTCTWPNDGECDDGGPGALYDGCEYGTDCADCGERPPR